MSDGENTLGKVDKSFFTEHIATRLGASRKDVSLGPTHGVDFGVVDVGGTALVMATDPLSVLPGLGFERAGRFAIDIVLSDVAVSGLAPSHVAIGLTLPTAMADSEFAAMWRGIHDELDNLGSSVVTGHTARYDSCSYPWIGAATAMAVGDHEAVIRPDGARPGDRLLVTNGPAVETAGLFSTLFPAKLEHLGLNPTARQAAQDCLADATCVRDALTAADAGAVHAMHDATEGGLEAALCEMADSARVCLDIDSTAVPMRPGVAELCGTLNINPWRCTSAGTLLIAVSPESLTAVRTAVAARGTPVEEIGTVQEGNGAYVDGEAIEYPDTDPSWQAYRRLEVG
jgi:hydrogenase expression/formation protein HypE